MPRISQLSRFQGCLLGLAIGDALGAAVEFKSRGTFEPVTGMRGGGTHGLKPGEWTDDTSMALCLADSLIEVGFDPADQMDRYWRWYSEGYNSVNEKCFDIGIATREALMRWRKTGEPFSGSASPDTAGNGALMRLAPIAMRYAFDPFIAMEYADKSTLTTHGAPEARICSKIFAARLVAELTENHEGPMGPAGYPQGSRTMGIAMKGYLKNSRSQIHGTGYCVESLEAALWCVDTTNSFKDAVLMAVNLGDDSDTTGAIAGQLAGAKYGVRSIPSDWISQLAQADRISGIAQNLMDLFKAERKQKLKL